MRAAEFLFAFHAPLPAPLWTLLAAGVAQVLLDLIPLFSPAALSWLGDDPRTTVPLTTSLSVILASLILLGTWPTALVTVLAQTVVALAYLARQGWRRPGVAALPLALGLGVLLAGPWYERLTGPFASGPLATHRELVLAVLAGVGIVLVKALVMSLALSASLDRPLESIWRAYLEGHSLLLELLFVTLGPFLALVYLIRPTATALLLFPFVGLYALVETVYRLGRRQQELVRARLALDAAEGRRGEVEAYLGAVTRAQEEERRRIARELHDDTVQRLLALSRGLAALRNEVRSTPEVAEQTAAELRVVAEEAAQAVRQFSMDLRPQVLDDLGLVPALHWLARRLEQSYGLAVTIEAPEGLRLPVEVELALFRIAQEALSNAGRHAQAKRAAVRLCGEPLQLVVRDDGRGFVPKTDGEHLGLRTMQERARLLGGTLEVTSGAGAGTTVTVTLPASVLPGGS